MKKLGKLEINSDKIMKNEELLTLRGGYDFHGCWCFDSDGYAKGHMAASNQAECTQLCFEAGGWFGWYLP
jgi:hypothetical protein